MPNYQHQKQFVDDRGLDLRSSEVTRARGFAREMLNMTDSPQGGVMPRFGHHKRQATNGWAGMFNFRARTMLQEDKDEILGVGGSSLENTKTLQRLHKYTVTFANTNAADTTVSFYYDNANSHFTFTIIRSGSTLLAYNTSGKTFSQLQTAIAAITGCTLSFSSALNSVSADYLSIKDSTVVAATTGTTTFDGYVWENVDQPQCRIEFVSADVSTANDTIDLHNYLANEDGTTDRYDNPLRNGDRVQVMVSAGGAAPTGLSVATDYYVVNATKTTIQLSASLGGSAINITGTGSGTRWIVPTYSPYATFENYAVCLANNASSFQNVSSVLMRNLMYFSSGPYKVQNSDSTSYRKTATLSKYDGQVHCIAGLPKPYFNSSTYEGGGAGTYNDPKGKVARGTITINRYVNYKARFAYVDKAGNYILGPLSSYRSGESSTGADGAADVRKIGCSGISGKGTDLPQRLGANGRYGVMPHAGGLTATVDFTGTITDGFGNNHSLKAGDIVYFWDNRQARFIQRELASVSNLGFILSTKSLDTDPTSPNFDDGANPDVAEDAVFTANLRILIYRTASQASASGDDPNAPYYLVGEFPYASPITNYYYDEMADTALGDELIEPKYYPGAPPKCRYLTKYNDQLIAGGDDTNSRTIYFDDIDSPEGFPPGTHSFDLPAAVNAVKQTAEVIFAATNNRTIHVISGDLSNFNFRVDEIASNLLCRSHDSCVEIDEGVIAFESDRGPQVLTGGRRLAPLGALKYPDDKVASRIEPFFIANYTNSSYQPAWSRSIGVFLPNERLYVLFIPVESTTGYSLSNYTVGQGSIAFVYNFATDQWRRWNGVDYSAMCQQNSYIFATSRLYDTGGGSGYIPISYTQKQVKDAGIYCYADHDAAILWKWQIHWESLNAPSILKKFLALRISNHEAKTAASYAIDVNTYLNYDTTLQSQDDTITWTTALDMIVKLKREKARSMMVEFTAQRFYEPFVFSGYEIEMVAPFRTEFKE